MKSLVDAISSLEEQTKVLGMRLLDLAEDLKDGANPSDVAAELEKLSEDAYALTKLAV
jgi:hypothetical protein